DLRSPCAQELGRHMPEIHHVKDPLGRALRIVAEWDAHLDGVPTFHLKEMSPQAASRMYATLTGRKPVVSVDRVLQIVGTRVNSHKRKSPALTWADIEAHPEGAGVIEKAYRFGYLP